MVHSVLPDVLAENLALVICGTAAGHASAGAGMYYAGPNNRFWAVLARIGLTPREFRPHEFRELLKFGIGLTDLAKGAAGMDRQVRSAELGVASLRAKIMRWKPLILALNGKRAAQAFLGRRGDYGRQPETVGQTLVSVLPSTSWANQRDWNETYWQEVADFIRQLRAAPRS